mmetsp:Transcript_50776/g.75255  ORF Transcript_50776/g.75255 Transcript_50776/m.75255 type:complete len:814 (-) Transcript_50776:247-2688(-)|eukprot:CAMPEP_0195512402 /NCGR_PEP_ID=MMETSP0794_2-20130614/4364_1 /TAXON_ID=515487 /ORGANISM="Stephanopyxis turris, Strain CCMP 815" /LENGTH=813 /DNA_ID=CAMNT_0040640175 /DNA_START=106 /DNA_END=2547 /DNA_ORIENTATION=+
MTDTTNSSCSGVKAENGVITSSSLVENEVGNVLDSSNKGQHQIDALKTDRHTDPTTTTSIDDKPSDDTAISTNIVPTSSCVKNGEDLSRKGQHKIEVVKTDQQTGLSKSDDTANPTTVPKNDIREERERLLQRFATLLGSVSMQQQNQADMSSAARDAASGLSPGKVLSLAGSVVSKSASSAIELRKMLVNDPMTMCALPGLDLFAGDVPDLASLSARSEEVSKKSLPESSSTSSPVTAGVASMPPPPPQNQARVKIPAMAASVFNAEQQPPLVLPPTNTFANNEDIPKVPADNLPNNKNPNPDKTASNAYQSGVKIPVMAASVFNAEQLSPGVFPPANSVANSKDTSKAPSENLPNNENLKSPTPASNAKVLEYVAAKNLSEPVTWTRSSLPQAPMTMLSALSSSFSSLVDSRMRSWILVLLKHSLNSGHEESRGRLLSLLAASNSINLCAVVTTFQTLKLPKEFASQKAEEEGKIILPVIFEAVIDILEQRKQVTVRLRAPGMLNGTFPDNSSLLLKNVSISLDTKALLACMVEQARLVVFKVVAAATTIPPVVLEQLVGAQTPVSNVSSHALKSPQESNNGFNGEQRLPQASPLQSFASMKLASKFSRTQSAALTLGNTRQNRSVTWDHTIASRAGVGDESPNQKRRKISSMVNARLRSSKSFGKPDANTFSCQRNATFAEFGRGHRNSNLANFMNVNTNMSSTYSTANVGGMSLNAKHKNSTFSSFQYSKLAAKPGGNATFDRNSTLGIRPINALSGLSRPRGLSLADMGSSNPQGIGGSLGRGLSLSRQFPEASMRAQQSSPKRHKSS